MDLSNVSTDSDFRRNDGTRRDVNKINKVDFIHIVLFIVIPTEVGICSLESESFISDGVVV